MRIIGKLDNSEHAERFIAYLVSQEIEAQAEREEDESWTIWARDEDQIVQAKEMFEAFRRDPDDKIYRRAVAKAQQVRREVERKQRQAAKNVVDMKQRWRRGEGAPTPLTRWLTILCVAITFVSWFQTDRNRPNLVARTMAFRDPMRPRDLQRALKSPRQDLFYDIMHGQVWRLFTPMFLHADLMHILFNMLLLNWFGKLIESRRGTATLAWIVLISSPVANVLPVVAPTALGGGVPAIGFSGVGYALFGYLWIGSQIDPRRDLFISPSAVFFLLAWLVLGFTGALDQLVGGKIANWGHLGGLLVGMTMAYIAARRR